MNYVHKSKKQKRLKQKDIDQLIETYKTESKILFLIKSKLQKIGINN